MAQDVDAVKLMGPCKVTIGGVDVGHVGEEGVTASIAGTVVEAKVAKYGDLPVGAWMNGQRVEVEFMLTQTDKDAMALALPLATKVVDGGDTKLTFGRIAGTRITAAELKLTPEKPGNTPDNDLTMPKAVPIGDFQAVYVGSDFTKWSCKFLVLANEATGADGSYGFTFGDTTISADAVAPTCGSTVPVDDATAISVDTTVVFNMSEELDPSTVNVDSVLLLEDPAGAGGGVVREGTVVLTNAGASTYITFTPATSLSAATLYSAVLTKAIKDKAGNAHGGTVNNFTTA